MRRRSDSASTIDGVLDRETSDEVCEGIHEFHEDSLQRGWDHARRLEAEERAADILSTREVITFEDLSSVMLAWTGRKKQLRTQTDYSSRFRLRPQRYFRTHPAAHWAAGSQRNNVGVPESVQRSQRVCQTARSGHKEADFRHCQHPLCVETPQIFK